MGGPASQAFTLPHRRVLYTTACFLAQQASEKALKSLLYYLGARRAALLTHSLVEMVQEGSKKVSSLLALLENAQELDLHYIPSRYPNGLPSGYPHQFYRRCYGAPQELS